MKSKGTIRLLGFLFTSLTGTACAIILTMIVIILGTIVINGLPGLSWEFISSSPKEGMTEGGIFPCIFGTAALVFLMTIAVIPLGVATAIYLHEYAKKDSKIVNLVRLAINNLAGVPAIVWGLFGLGFFVSFVGGTIDGFFFNGALHYRKACMIWASLTMALLTLPTVVVATEEALKAVPQAHREAAYALGATRWQVVWKIVLPQSMSGILTGGILSISRGASEIAPIMFTGVTYYLKDLPSAINDKFMNLGFHIYSLTTQMPDVEATMPILYSTILILLLLTFALNFVAVIIRSRIRRKLRGA